VVHAFQASMLVAEALYYRGPARGRTWSPPPQPGLLDAAVAAYMVAWVLAGLLTPR